MADKNEKEIDLLELARKLWGNKKFIIKVTIVGVVIGLIIAFSIPKEYTTTVVFTVNSNKKSAGNMGVLASLAGVNLGANQSSEPFSPELYPNVIYATPFVQGLLDIRILDKKSNIDTTLYYYLKNAQKTAWWSTLLKIPQLLLTIFKSDPETNDIEKDINPYFISKEEMEVINKLKNSYSIETDKKTGVTTFEVVAQSSFVSAFLADTLTSYLQSYIIKERTRKANQDLENTEKLYKKAKIDYFKAQQELAEFIDANQNVISARYKLKQEKLQSEMNLFHSVYNQVAQQLQLDRIKVQDDTPVFTMIQPAIEPLYPEKPSKKIIIIATFIISVVGCSLWILRKDFLNIIIH